MSLLQSGPISINVFGTPPTIEQIQAWKQEISNTHSLAEKVVIWTPIPIVDFVAGMATALVMGDKFDPIRYTEEADKRDWSANSTTLSYTQKVKAMGRPLIEAEVTALERHLTLTSTMNYVAKTAVSVVSDGVVGALKDALKTNSIKK